MEKHEYILKLPLKQMVLRNIAINLWCGADILNLVKQFRYQTSIDDFRTKEWHSEVEKKVKEKISLLVLPQAIRKELMHTVEPIGPEILKWKKYHNSLRSDVGEFLDQLRWTSVGTVDYRETAKALVKQERIHSVDRDQLAFVYGIDDYIPLFPSLDYGAHGLNEFAFINAAQEGNKDAAQYCFKKLTVKEKENCLLNAALKLVAKASTMCIISFDFPKNNYCDTLCFLLSQMDEEKQMKVFKKDAYTCLRCFLNWPWQDLFMKLVRVTWEYLSKKEYWFLITILACDNCIFGCRFSELFAELFLYAPSDYREYLFYEQQEQFWFRCLFFKNDIESIKLVLRNVDSSVKERFIIGYCGADLCLELIKNGKWFLLELFIAECHLSKEARSRLKKVFRGIFVGDEELKRKRFFHLIDTANVEDFSKRSLEDLENEEHNERERYEEISREKRRKRF